MSRGLRPGYRVHVPEPEERLFSFREMRVSGASALEHGLPKLPEEQRPSMVIPVACWKTALFGAVVFLSLSTPESDSEFSVGHVYGTYQRIDEGWSPRGNFYGAPGWGGPMGPPGATDGLEGQAITKGAWETASDLERGQGQPATLVWGWHSPEVMQILLVQGERRETYPSGHYGTWVIGIESEDPWRIEAHDHSGGQLGFVDKDSHLQPT
jgi:hypothetical protein